MRTAPQMKIRGVMSGALSSSHRLLFPAAAAIAIFVVAATSGMLSFSPSQGPLPGIVAWHAHEMLFGFVGAGFAAYTLTAMRSWSITGGPSGIWIAVLILLWVAARMTALGTFSDAGLIVVPLGVGFLALVALILGRAALRSKSWNGGFQAIIALALTGYQTAILMGETRPLAPVLVLAILLTVVCGRVVAGFSWSRLEQREEQQKRYRLGTYAGNLGAFLIFAVILLDASGQPAADFVANALLMAAAGLTLAQLLCWQSRRIWQDGLLVMLHLAYLWLPVGLALLALARSEVIAIPPTTALHALTVGAISGSIYAVAARAVARRNAHLVPLRADLLGYALLWAAAVLRVFSEAGGDLFAIAPMLWIAGWTVFLVRHAIALTYAPPRPVFSGRSRVET